MIMIWETLLPQLHCDGRRQRVSALWRGVLGRVRRWARYGTRLTLVLALAPWLMIAPNASAVSWDNPAVAGRASTSSKAVYSASAEYPCEIADFESEAAAIANYLECLPHDSWFQGGEHRYYESFRLVSEGVWTRYGADGSDPGYKRPPNYAIKALVIGFTVRSVYGDGHVETLGEYTYGHSMSRYLACPACYGFEVADNAIPITQAPAALTCNPERNNRLCEKYGSCSIGNPVYPDSGRKIQPETDIDLPATGQRFERLYDSSKNAEWLRSATMGVGWRHSYDRSLAVVEFGSTVSIRRYASTPHPQLHYSSDGTTFASDADIKDVVAQVVDAGGQRVGWSYYEAATENVERYDTNGRLLSITARSGSTQTLSYDANGLLVGVTDPVGRSITFEYDPSDRISRVTDPAGAIFDYGYDASGNLASVTGPPDELGLRHSRLYLYENATLPNNLTGITDENGWRYATFVDDSSGRVSESKHQSAAGVFVNRYQFTYTQLYNGNLGQQALTSVTDPLGTVRTYSYQEIVGANRQTGISQPCLTCGMASSAQTFDANGNVASRADFNGKKACYAYDLTRNLETARVEGLTAAEDCLASLASPPNRADVRKVTTTWHSTFRLPATVTEPAPGGSKTTALTYDASGNLLQKVITAPANDGSGTTITRSWTWTYASRGRVLTATDPIGKVTSTTYYADNDADLGKRGNVATIANAAAHTTQITAYDFAGRPLSITDANGMVTTLGYDARGRLLYRDAGGERTDYGYDGVGQLTAVMLPDDSTLQYTYDGAHRLTQIQDGLGNKIVYTLDAMGNRTHEDVYDASGALARTRSRTFDALNRLATELGANNQTTTYGYDNNGNLTAVTDPLARQTVNAYDALNRLVRVTDPGAGATVYSYDGTGTLLQVNDPRDLATRYGMDGLGNQTKLTSPDTGVTSQTFDAAGNVLSRMDARGVTATYTYDLLNRVTQIVYAKSGSPSETHAFEYDGGTGGAANAKGRLTKVTDPSAVTTWSYTPQGRVAGKTQVIGSRSFSTSYGYNGAGQLTSLTTPSGQALTFTYVNNRPGAISVNGLPLVTGAEAEPFAGMAAWHWGNGLYSFRDYDQDGRIQTWEFRNGTSVLRRDVAWDNANRITAIADPANALNNGAFGYDALDRLTAATVGSATRAYTYDAVGNRLSATTDGAAAALDYGLASNQLLQLAGSVDAGYLNGDTVRSFTYNLANRLVAVSNGSTSTSYAVNALGQRVKKTAAGVDTYFVYDEQGRLVGEYDGAGALIQETVWLEDLPVATLRPSGSGNPVPVAVYYVHADHLGTPRAVTRPSDNAFLWRWDNVDPFGNNGANENPAGAGAFTYHLRFPGQYYDTETKTHYNYFRDYDPTSGRYEQSDPIGLWSGLNTYGYVGAKPLSHADPEGRQALPPVPAPPIVGPIPPPPIPGLPGTPPPRFHIPELPMPRPIDICMISPALCGAGAAAMAVASICKPDDKCEEQAKRDEAMCKMATLPRTGARSRCWQSVQDRFGACKAGRPLPPLVTW
ncbi:MAG: RHS repeat-associated core domain-containing protein [Betaproteobacteria bacterium]